MDKKVFVVDSQRLNGMQACMRKYSYTFGQSLEPVETPIQFERGDIFHHFMEFYYNARKVRHLWDQNKLTHADVVQQGIDDTRAYALEKSIGVDEVEDLIRVVHEYVEHYQNDGWDNIIAIEKVATKQLYEDDKYVVAYEGKLDLIIGLQNYPAIWIDHKTEKRKSYPSDMVNQFLGYSWLLGINNGIVNKVGFQKTVKAEEKFRREVISYTDARIKEWEENTIWTIKESLKLIEQNKFPMNLTSCDKYAGCTYRSICMSTPEDRDRKLTELFQIREKQWDVGLANES